MQMISNNFGKNLKELRKKRGLTQKKVSEGICEQSLISKIESGQTFPSMNITFGLLKRLGIDMEHFYSITIDADIKKKTKIKNMLKRALRNRNFIEVEKIFDSIEENVFDDDVQFKQIRLWKEAFELFYIHNDYNKCLELLSEAFNLISKKKEIYTELELEILNAEIEVHYDQEMYFVSEKLAKKALDYYQNSMINFSDGKLKIRLLYNLIKALTKLNKNKDALNYCHLVEKEIFENKLMYLLGEVYEYTAINLKVLGEIKRSEEYFNKANIIFKIKDQKI